MLVCYRTSMTGCWFETCRRQLLARHVSGSRFSSQHNLRCIDSRRTQDTRPVLRMSRAGLCFAFLPIEKV